MTKVAHCVRRSRDRLLLFEADYVDGVTRLRVFDTTSGRLLGSGKGAISWPAEPELALVADSANHGVCVTGTCLIATAWPALEKLGPDGARTMVATSSWQRVQGVKSFNAKAAVTDHPASP